MILTELIDAAIERRLKALTLNDLPIAALQRRLEQRWQPDAATLLLPGTVTREALAQKFDYGTATVTWPGGSPVATTLTVSHDLGVVPAGVVGTLDATAAWAACLVDTFTASTFDLYVRTFDGTSPVAATATTVYWIAFA